MVSHAMMYGGVEMYLCAFLTPALDCGGQLHVMAALPLSKEPMVSAEQEAPEPLWTLRRRENCFAPAGDRNPDLSIVQPVGKSLYRLSYPGSL